MQLQARAPLLFAAQPSNERTNQMSQLEEGNFPFVVTSASYGADDRGVPVVQINGKFTEGPNSGRTTTYQDEINAKSALYVGRSCRAVGWKGVELETLAADTEVWIKATGGATTAEIRHIELKKGKKFDKWVADGSRGQRPYWDKCNSIGYGAKPLVAPKKDVTEDANAAMRRAMAEDGGSDEAPTGYVSAPSVPAGRDDDLPFATCSTIGLGEIARVLRGAL